MDKYIESDKRNVATNPRISQQQKNDYMTTASRLQDYARDLRQWQQLHGPDIAREIQNMETVRDGLSRGEHLNPINDTITQILGAGLKGQADSTQTGTQMRRGA